MGFVDAKVSVVPRSRKQWLLGNMWLGRWRRSHNTYKTHVQAATSNEKSSSWVAHVETQLLDLNSSGCSWWCIRYLGVLYFTNCPLTAHFVVSGLSRESSNVWVGGVLSRFHRPVRVEVYLWISGIDGHQGFIQDTFLVSDNGRASALEDQNKVHWQ